MKDAHGHAWTHTGSSVCGDGYSAAIYRRVDDPGTYAAILIVMGIGRLQPTPRRFPHESSFVNALELIGRFCHAMREWRMVEARERWLSVPGNALIGR